MKKLLLVSFTAVLFFSLLGVYKLSANNNLPEGFVYLKNINDRIIQNLRYVTTDNFFGRKIINYEGSDVICTEEAAIALSKVQEILENQGYGLVIYDAYRPASASLDFYNWCYNQTDVNETSKRLYYPYIAKDEIYSGGYVAKKSGHNRGSTVDLTIIKLGQKIKPIVEQALMLTDGTIIHIPYDNTVFMGGGFDLLHEASHHGTALITQQATNNRQILRKAMEASGFKILQEQWWHYTLINEPFPDTFFDFPVRNEYQNLRK